MAGRRQGTEECDTGNARPRARQGCGTAISGEAGARAEAAAPARRRRRRGVCLALMAGLAWPAAGAGLPAAAAARLEAMEQRLQQRPEASAGANGFCVYAAACVAQGQYARGQATLARILTAAAGRRGSARIPTSALDMLTQAADAYLILRRWEERAAAVPCSEDFARWLFGSERRLSLFLDTMTDADDWASCLGIIQQLYAHDPDGRDEFRNLILALAVVWDQPRPQLHGQMGEHPLPYEPEITARYDYFRTLYARNRAAIPYRHLSVVALVLVVDVPVPLSELEWAREHVRGSASGWRRKFTDIDYVERRAVTGQFQWPHGAYSLAAIEEHGGICVDQAYYATLTARAHGIPALLFVGQGRRGPHAWFGYLKSEGRWELDTGRYTYDRYATGHALDPQLNRPLTDHDLEYICDRALQSGRYSQATRYARLATALLDLGHLDAAAQGADLSIRLVRAYDPPWRILEAIHLHRQEPRQLLELLDRKANAFRRYADYVAGIRQQQADLLRRLGDNDEAAALLERQEKRLDRDRDDLARRLAADQIQVALDGGDPEEAREKLEDLLKAQRDEGQKTVALLQAYLTLTMETKQTKAAAQFLRRYIPSMQRRYARTPAQEAFFLEMLLQAYLNDDDTRNVERTRRKLERLR